MVLDFTCKLSVKLCRYCAHFLHLPLWPILHLFDILLQFALNHSVSIKLRCVNKSLFKPILLFLCFIWDTQNNQLKVFILEGLLGLYWIIESQTDLNRFIMYLVHQLLHILIIYLGLYLIISPFSHQEQHKVLKVTRFFLTVETSYYATLVQIFLIKTFSIETWLGQNFN